MDSNILCILTRSLRYTCMINYTLILARFSGYSIYKNCILTWSIDQVSTILLLIHCHVYHTLKGWGILPLLYIAVYSSQMALLQQLRLALSQLLLPHSVPFNSVSQHLILDQQRVALYKSCTALSERLLNCIMLQKQCNWGQQDLVHK